MSSRDLEITLTEGSIVFVRGLLVFSWKEAQPLPLCSCLLASIVDVDWG